MISKQFILLFTIFVSLGQCDRTNVKSLFPKNRRGFIRRICPSKVKLNCANVMYSKPCNQNYDCSYAGPQLVCCETGCPGAGDDTKFVCVPEENSRCPYLQPVTYTGLMKCRVDGDCERDFTCCFNIAGEGYCHKPTEAELLKRDFNSAHKDASKQRGQIVRLDSQLRYILTARDNANFV